LKYRTILADPPWSYDDPSLERGGALRHYQTMSIEEICGLPIAALAADDCVLFMWATFPKLFECGAVIKAWGFEYKTCAFVWIKTNKRLNPDQASFFPVDSFDSFWGMGRWTRSNAEICLLGVRGQPKRLSASVHQLIYAPVSKHSRKPPETRDRIIELCGDVSRVELFARDKADGWDSWGNEVTNDIELTA
jgi:N6-adenosine-specific RNA methylase IME4